MARAFANIALTPTVQAAQARMGSRGAYRTLEVGEVEEVALGTDEIDFIRARDSFYQGTVGENGSPYVQHRGGPTGFLQVLDARTLGYADFSGNRQYISVGNLDANDRVSLFLMDYPAQRRLKIWGRARVIDEDTQPELLARLESPHYRARVERGVIITVEAFDWNCPKHITPRFTAAEITAHARGGQQQAGAGASIAAELEPIGTDALELVVTGMRQLTPRVRAYELRAPDFSDLPAVTAGAHLAVPVRLADGIVVTRQYSLITHPQRRDGYEIAVLHKPEGRGGSAAIHATWRLGTRLASEFPGELHLYFTRAPGGARIGLASIMRDAPAGALFYVCGPGPLLSAARAAARQVGFRCRPFAQTVPPAKAGGFFLQRFASGSARDPEWRRPAVQPDRHCAPMHRTEVGAQSEITRPVD